MCFRRSLRFCGIGSFITSLIFYNDRAGPTAALTGASIFGTCDASFLSKIGEQEALRVTFVFYFFSVKGEFLSSSLILS